ncbi:DMT family transporter [Sphingomonas sp. AP4-R1]|jgi:transporter family-2 protein|uniref:DMT family transporter n=1 Tax=Sphingomonas sp. AP4-R1 TaxID=2735134 RepID=UPI0014935EB4|nr:DMT family transporter [Sphingomonas sp. AP4-R1]QJU59202.1 DMT family transporter [Sphingomonas sp. AP4-R1]
MRIIFIIIALSAGIASALQSGANQTLKKALDAPLWAAALVALVTAATSITVVLASGERLPAAGAAAAAPWWAWAGGFLGVGFVLGTVFAAPKLGAGLFMASIVTAELITGLLLDHFGLLGFDMHPIGWGRIIGAALMIIGLSLIAIF